ncbi:hypothetical protein ACP70R_011650 [Stipagrostis hirtigluma subsp. patula]
MEPLLPKEPVAHRNPFVPTTRISRLLPVEEMLRAEHSMELEASGGKRARASSDVLDVSMELEASGGKRARASSEVLDIDRLSALPDCLIHHIMSFMKARQVVQTCVLSTRWTHLWRSVPCLNLDQVEFSAADSDADTAESDSDNDKEEQWEKFEDFTDHLLIRGNISIALLDTFRLHARGEHHRQAARWIRHGVKYSTQEHGVQRELLNSTSWRLRRLHLSNVYLDDRFAKHVRSGCHSLEDLELKGCMIVFDGITSCSLKNLVLKCCRWRGPFAITSPTLKSLVIETGYITFFSVAITAPAVAYLLLGLDVNQFEGGVSFNDEMASLAKASIHLRCNNVMSILSSNQFKLLDSVSNVTSLELSGFRKMMEFMVPPYFKNLKSLLLDSCYLGGNFQILGHFLHKSPNLEKLTLYRCMIPMGSQIKKGSDKLKERLNLVGVQCKNLKLTEIIYADEDDDDDVHNLVEVLLGISGSLPNNNIKLIKVDLHYP